MKKKIKGKNPKGKRSKNAKNRNKNKKHKEIINKNMTFAEILDKNPEAGLVLMEHGMHCIGCSMGAGETLEQGAIMHGLDPDKLIKKINKTK